MSAFVLAAGLNETPIPPALLLTILGVGARIDLRLQVSAGSLFRRGGDGLGRGL